jgi:hypothetical protein
MNLPGSFLKGMFVKVVIFGMALICSPVFAQLTNQEIEQRMGELNKKATTKPATTKPTSTSKFLKWQAKPNASKEIKEWINSFESVRSSLISQTNANIGALKTNDQNEAAKLADELRLQNIQLEKVKNRYIRHYTDRGDIYTDNRGVTRRQVLVAPPVIYNERDLAEQNEDKKEIEGQISRIKAQITRLHKNTDDNVKALTEFKTKMYNLEMPPEYAQYAEQTEVTPAIATEPLINATSVQASFMEEANRRLDQLLSTKPKVTQPPK